MTKSKNSDFKQLLTKDSLLTRKMRSGRMIHGKKPPKEEMETKFPNRSKLFFPRKGIPSYETFSHHTKQSQQRPLLFLLEIEERNRDHPPKSLSLSRPQIVYSAQWVKL